MEKKLVEKENAINRTVIASEILKSIDEYCVRTYDGGHRKHLGASLIGDKCSRKLWYSFRWCFREKIDGRKYRLFNRGHREEARFIEWLAGIGAKIDYENYESFAYRHDTDSYHILKPGECNDCHFNFIKQDNPNFQKHVNRAKADGLNFPQFRISGVMGHFGGSLDGIVTLPERFGMQKPVLCEFKTKATGAGFNKLCNEGMAVAEHRHYCQTSVYGSDPAYNFENVLYMSICKNDDSMHVEIVEINKPLGDQMRNKAERIILSSTAPARLSDNPTFFECKWCGAFELCHKRAIPEKNCRSCGQSKPVENGQWFCGLYQNVIPESFVPTGCGEYFPITSEKI